jgi:predicted nucleic acid-binding protein
MTHLLDTTALLAHFLDESGAEEVAALLALGPKKIALAAPSWVEFHTRLRELVEEPEIVESTFRHYTESLTTLIALDESAVRAAMRLRAATPGRLPLADALIAGTAAAADIVLVHRDTHFDAIPGLKAMKLPEK